MRRVHFKEIRFNFEGTLALELDLAAGEALVPALRSSRRFNGKINGLGQVTLISY
jgi:hypothetical protein